MNALATTSLGAAPSASKNCRSHPRFAALTSPGSTFRSRSGPARRASAMVAPEPTPGRASQLLLAATHRTCDSSRPRRPARLDAAREIVPMVDRRTSREAGRHRPRSRRPAARAWPATGSGVVQTPGVLSMKLGPRKSSTCTTRSSLRLREICVASVVFPTLALPPIATTTTRPGCPLSTARTTRGPTRPAPRPRSWDALCPVGALIVPRVRKPNEIRRESGLRR
jgi:hypothetical protein